MRSMPSLVLCLATVMSVVHAAPDAGHDFTLRCELRPSEAITLQARPHGTDGHALYTIWQGHAASAFGEDPEAPIVGELRMAACVQRTLLYAIDHGPPYLQGAALRVNPVSGQLERIDFAEKALPSHLDLGQGLMRLVFPNQGGEHSLRYILYRSDQTEASPASRLPRPDGSFRRHSLRGDVCPGCPGSGRAGR